MSRRVSFFCSTLCVALLAPVATANAQSDEHVVEAMRREAFVREVDDAIDVANGDPPLPHAPIERPPSGAWSGMTQVAIIFHRFFGSVVPNSTGVERSSVDAHIIDEFEVHLDGRLSFVLLGAANYRALTRVHFYQQFDGILALRYDLYRYEGTPFRVALVASPLYGSLTSITRHSGVYDDESLPSSTVVGAAGGIDAWYSLRLVIFHARVLALPGVDVGDGATGVSLVQTVQMKWRLTEVFGWDPTWPIDMGVIAMHLDRGAARSSVWAWQGDFRSPAELREVWQLMAILELRVD